MATRKITVTLPGEQVQEIRALVMAGQTNNVSAFVQHAVRTALSEAAGWHELLRDALEQTGGPLKTNERTSADALLGYRSGKKRSRKGKAA